MAIIIPSKNIYQMNNPKVRDNVIDNASVEQSLVKEVKEYQEQVYSTKIDLSNQTVGNEIVDQKGKIGSYIGSSLQYSICSYISILPTYISNYTIKFNKLLINKLINKVYLGKDKNEYNEIKSTIKYSLNEYSARGTANIIVTNSGTTASFENISHNDTPTSETSSSVSLFSPQLEHKFEETNSYGIQSITADVTNKFNNLTNLLGDKKYIETDDYISFDIDILSAYNITTLGGYDDDFYSAPNSVSANGVYQEYTATEIEISVYGDTIGIDLTDGSVTYGSGDKPFSLSGNELLQDSTKTNGSATTECLANNVLTQYGKGKETATLLCSISDYYDENNLIIISPNINKTPFPKEYINISFFTSVVISTITISISQPYNNLITAKVKYKYASSGYKEREITIKRNQKYAKIVLFGVNILEVEVIDAFISNEMSFELHDKVVPMIYGADGKDHPMSKYQDGNPKVFEVTGTNIIYDGAVWQELTLLEKSQQNA